MVIVVVDIVGAVVVGVCVVGSVVVVKNTEFEVKGVLSSVLLFYYRLYCCLSSI